MQWWTTRAVFRAQQRKESTMPEAYKFPDEIEDEKKGQQQNAAPEDEIEVEIVDDTPEKDRGRKPLDKNVEDPTDEEIESYSDKVQSRIKELTHARHDERRAKEAVSREKQELERVAQQLLAENKRLQKYVSDGTQQFAAGQVQVAEAEIAAARAKYKEAQEAFDTDAIIAAQEALADAKWKLNAAKNFRAPALQQEEPVVQQRQVQTPVDEPDEKTLRWQAKNQWFGAEGFEEVTSYALGLHQKLVNSGVDPRSDEYFDQINGRVKTKFPEVFGDEEKPKPGGAPKKPGAVVAPAARTAGVKKIQLTATQVALAKKFGLTPQQYAAQVAKLENQNG
jgi:hypothetical protein